MGIAADKLRKMIKDQVNKNIQKLDHDVDCIVQDLRRGKSSGVNIKKTMEFIEDSKTLIAKIEKPLETLEKIQDALEASRKAAEAARKANVVGSAAPGLNAMAALGIAAEFIIKGLNTEVDDLKSVTNVAPSIVSNYSDFLSRSATKIATAKIEKELKDSVREDRRNMTS